MIAACTVVSPNYLPFARTLARSYVAQHPGQRFFVLLVADGLEMERFAGEPFAAVALDSIGLADIRGEAMKYDILELNTNVKPRFLQFLLSRYGLEQLVYLDPDIFVYYPLEPVFRALAAGATAVLTPHITSPIRDAKSPAEQDMLYNGTYNLGFIAVRRCPETDRMLAWWSERCLALGFSEGRTGLFVDQKWMNLAPGLFAGVSVLRDPGCNMAYWNLHERTLVETNGRPEVIPAEGESVPLRFFHFSGVALGEDGALSRHTDRFTVTERPDLRRLFAEYRAAVQENSGRATDALPYGFDRFSDGTVVTRLARRIYAAQQPRWEGQDPFDARGRFAVFARRQHLIAGKQAEGKSTWKEFDPRDRRVLLVHRLLRMALRVLGPHRYELLMRYLGHISVLRHQAVLFDRS